MQQRCDCNNGTFPFRRCSSCSVAQQRRRRATCLRTSASLCPSVDHASSSDTLLHVSVMHDSARLHWLCGARVGAMAWRFGGWRMARPPLDRSRGTSSVCSPSSRLCSLHLRAILYSTWHAYATVGHLPFSTLTYVRDIQLQKQGNAPLGSWLHQGLRMAISSEEQDQSTPVGCRLSTSPAPSCAQTFCFHDLVINPMSCNCMLFPTDGLHWHERLRWSDQSHCLLAVSMGSPP